MRNGCKMGLMLTWTIITALKSKKVTFCMQSRRSSLQLIYRVICTISKMNYDLGKKFMSGPRTFQVWNTITATWRAFFQGMLCLRGDGGIAVPFPAHKALNVCARFLYIASCKCLLHEQGNIWKAVVCNQAVLMDTSCSDVQQLSGQDLDKARRVQETSRA